MTLKFCDGIKLGMKTFEPSLSDLSSVMFLGYGISIPDSIPWKTGKYGCLEQSILLSFRKKEVTPMF